MTDSPTTSPCWDERVQRIYQSGHSKEPNNVRISLYDRDPSNVNDIVKVRTLLKMHGRQTDCFNPSFANNILINDCITSISNELKCVVHHNIDAEW